MVLSIKMRIVTLVRESENGIVLVWLVHFIVIQNQLLIMLEMAQNQIT